MDYEYNVGDKVIIKAAYLKKTQKVKFANKGPFSVVEVFNNGVIRIRRGNVEENINIRRVNPFFERSSTIDE